MWVAEGAVLGKHTIAVRRDNRVYVGTEIRPRILRQDRFVVADSIDRYRVPITQNG